MYRNRIMALLAILLVASLVLGACTPSTPAETDAPTDTDAGDTETPTDAGEDMGDEMEPETTDRNGAMLDTIVLVEEANFAAAANRVVTGDLGAFSLALSQAEPLATLQGSDEACLADVYGLFYEFTFNHGEGSTLFEDGRFNPFGDQQIREAMHWLTDRNHIANEIMEGNALPRYTAVNPSFPTGASLADVFKAIEIEYGYNPERAAEVVNARMTELGAEMVDGVWQYEGEDVVIHFLIRVEDHRLPIGDYLANQIEDLGFTVTRQYDTSANLFPLWGGTNPSEGAWSVYTGGWAASAISRTDATTLSQYYTDRILPWPIAQTHTPDPALLEAADGILNASYSSLEERAALFEDGLWLSMEDANRIFIVTQLAKTGYRCELSMATDLAGGLAGSWLWANTLRYVGDEGGSVTIGSPSIMTQPWNPIAGSNWLYDQMPIRATGEPGVVPNPYTGLLIPHRVESATVEAQSGLPIGTSSDWVTLSFSDEVAVPGDAWSDWDAETQTFITADERFPEGTTSLVKTTVTYPADLYESVTWHDGSNFSAGDVVMAMIMTFDRAKEASAMYDASAVGAFDAFMATFKGVRIASTDPLVIETWTDAYDLDAETAVVTWWPFYGFGQGAWHNLALGISAETAGELAYSNPKATELEVENTSFIGGPSLEILNTHLGTLTESGEIPYAPTMGDYVTADEAASRYANLAEWYRVRGHFWIGTGVFYLERAFPVEGTLILQRYLDHPDNSLRWAQFASPAIPEVVVDGPDQVTIGEEASYDVFVEFEGAAYAASDISSVSYLIVDGTGAVAASGTGEAMEDGHWVITLPADVTGALAEGSNSLEVVVVSNLVAIPTSVSYQFITTP